MAKDEKFHVNSVDIEGLITKIWDRDGDGLAIYDEQAEILEPGKGGELPKRQAHYVTLQCLDGKTADGVPREYQREGSCTRHGLSARCGLFLIGIELPAQGEEVRAYPGAGWGSQGGEGGHLCGGEDIDPVFELRAPTRVLKPNHHVEFLSPQ